MVEDPFDDAFTMFDDGAGAGVQRGEMLLHPYRAVEREPFAQGVGTQGVGALHCRFAAFPADTDSAAADTGG